MDEFVRSWRQTKEFDRLNVIAEFPSIKKDRSGELTWKATRQGSMVGGGGGRGQR